jgi:hypothetical protein
MTFRTLLVPALASLAAALAGCFDVSLGNGLGPDATTGEAGRASFSYASDLCIFGCDLSTAMMTGSTEIISVVVTNDATLPRGLTVSVDDASVLTATLTDTLQCCTSAASGGGCSAIQPDGPCAGTVQPSYSLSVVAVGPGAATLALHAADASVFDSVVVHVASPAALAFSCTSDGAETAQTSSVTLGVGQECDFTVTATDATNTLLRATSGFQITTTNPSVAVPQPSVDLGVAPASGPVTGSLGEVLGSAPGTTQLVIQASGLSQTVPVTVQ